MGSTHPHAVTHTVSSGTPVHFCGNTAWSRLLGKQFGHSLKSEGGSFCLTWRLHFLALPLGLPKLSSEKAITLFAFAKTWKQP